MTLESAIQHCEEVAEELKEEAIKGCCDDTEIMDDCLECASEHRQLVAWLRELKAYRESRKEITRKMNSGQWSEGVVYGLDKAVRTMEKHLMEVNADE